MPADLKRREFSREVRAEMVRRATVQHTLFCEGCGLDLTGKEIEFDHTIAEAYVLDKSRKLTAADGKVLGKACCHREAGGKTAQDTAGVAKVKRQEANHHGFATATAKPLPPGRPAKRATTPLLKQLPPRVRPLISPRSA